MYFVEKIITDELIEKSQLPEGFNHDNTVFFDIEASGLSPKYSVVFLIGILYFKKGNLVMRQYYANNYDEEVEILASFVEDIRHFETIYHFNGLSFDIPFVNERLVKNNIKYQLSKEISVDIFQAVKKNKKTLGLESCKLKSVEEYMDIYREDDLSGKEVADFYKSYVNNQAHEIRDKILLHNEEDIINLYKILPILNLINKRTHKKSSVNIENYKVELNDEKVVINGLVLLDHSDNIEFNDGGLSFRWDPSTKNFDLNFLIEEGLLYYMYKDYRQYYYFPEIDQAVHKSFAKYYSYENRVPAKALNCYTKQSSKYIKLPFSFEGGFKMCSEAPTSSSDCLTVNEFQKNIGSESLLELLNLILEKLTK